MFTGCLPPKIDLRDYKVCAPVSELPETFECKRVGKIKHQGTVGSCVAHATSSILENINNYPQPLSTNFIYGIQKKVLHKTGPGMHLNDACKIIQKYGDMLEMDCPGNDEIPLCYSKADLAFSDSTKLERAEPFKISSYYACYTINDIKYALYNYGPVLASVKWYESYHIDNLNRIIMNKGTDNGYHAIMIYGWNKEGFLIQNSWGKTFGRNGTCVYPYSEPISEAKAFIRGEISDDALNTTHYSTFATLVIKFLNLIINFIVKKGV